MMTDTQTPLAKGARLGEVASPNAVATAAPDDAPMTAPPITELFTLSNALQ